MKSYVKIAFAAFLVSTTLFLTACDDWVRIKNANTIAVVGMGTSTALTEFDNNGNPKESGSGLGFGEAAGMLGGLVKGNGASAAQDVIAKRDANLKQTEKNATEFQNEMLGLVKDALQKGRFTVKNYDCLTSINLREGNLAKSLIKEAGTDAIVECTNAVGYIKEDKSFGLSKEYRLAIQTNATFADKDGVIGTRTYFISAPQRHTSDSAIPGFPKEDFEAVKNQLIAQIRTDLISFKLK